MAKRRGSKGSGLIGGEYDVGYGKPPRKHQFKPGQSGNPRGRPTGSKGLAALLKQELDRRVTIRENGVLRTITKKEAATKQFANKITMGDPRAWKFYVEHLQVPEAIEDPGRQAKIDAGFKEFVDALDKIAAIKGNQKD